jgi:hypothetical protein
MILFNEESQKFWQPLKGTLLSMSCLQVDSNETCVSLGMMNFDQKIADIPQDGCKCSISMSFYL